MMALERVPADIRAQGGVARMASPIQDPRDPGGGHDPGDGEGADRALRRGPGAGGARGRLHRRVRGADPADEANHIDKWAFKVPFVCGAIDLGEALRRIAEGAAMIRTKGEAGTGNVVEAVRHMRAIRSGIRRLASTDQSRSCRPPPRSCARRSISSRRWPQKGRLPVVNFSAGGLATPADAALVVHSGRRACSWDREPRRRAAPPDPRRRAATAPSTPPVELLGAGGAAGEQQLVGRVGVGGGV